MENTKYDEEITTRLGNDLTQKEQGFNGELIVQLGIAQLRHHYKAPLHRRNSWKTQSMMRK